MLLFFSSTRDLESEQVSNGIYQASGLFLLCRLIGLTYSITQITNQLDSSEPSNTIAKCSQREESLSNVNKSSLCPWAQVKNSTLYDGPEFTSQYQVGDQTN